MILPLLLLTASAQHDHSQHLDPEQIAEEINSIKNSESNKIVEYIRDAAHVISELEKDEAKTQKTTKEELDQWYSDNLKDYYDAFDKILLGNQVCLWKFPRYEHCRVADIFQAHGHLGNRGETYRQEFMAEVRGYISKLTRGDEL